MYAISSALKDAPYGTQQLQIAAQATALAREIAEQLNNGTADPTGCTRATVLDGKYEQWRQDDTAEQKAESCRSWRHWATSATAAGARAAHAYMRKADNEDQTPETTTGHPEDAKAQRRA